MHRYLFGFMNNLRLRWKMLVVVLPLVIIPIFVVGGVIGYISTRQAYLGITQTSKDDLEHMTSFTLDLLNSHYQQFQVYKQDKAKSFNHELATLTNISYSVVEAEHRQYKKGLALMPICFGISFTNTGLNQASSLVHVYTDGSVGVSVSSTNPDLVAPVSISFQLGVIRMSDSTRSTAASAAYSVWLPAR